MPLDSAFEKWENTMPGYRIIGNKTHFTTERKEGWDAALEEIEKWFCKGTPDGFQNYIKEKITELKK